ncbi:hypothetical protein M3Y96_00002700 [Aphelenchoides besseyi]|nr:hypothetical protein M3Y96_00002700 [Aphelenchoides besseyi]
MLRKRIEALSTEYHMRIQTLLLLQVHYKILVFVADLNKKIESWKVAHSSSILQRWIGEFQAEQKTRPRQQGEKLIQLMRDAMTGNFALPKLNAREALEANRIAVEDVISRFEALGTSLERQKRAWDRFERETKKLEAALTVSNVDEQQTNEEAAKILADCAMIADKIVRLSGSAAAKSALGERLATLNSKMKSKPAAPSRLTKKENTVATEETVSKVARIHVRPSPAEEMETKEAEYTLHRLNAFVRRVKGFLRKTPANKQDVNDLIADLNDSEKAFDDYDKLLEDVEKLSGVDKKETRKIAAIYAQQRIEIKNRVHKLNSLKPIIAFVENNLYTLQLWTTHHDPDSPMAQLSIKERADLVEHIGRELEILEQPENMEIVNPEHLRATQRQISELFVQKSEMQEALNELDEFVKQGGDMSKRVDLLRARFEEQMHKSNEASSSINVNPQLQKQRIDELLKRKAEVIRRPIDSDTAARGAINEMQMINVTLVHLKVANDKRNLALERQWSELYALISRLLSYQEKVKELSEKSQHERDALQLWHLIQDVDGLTLILDVMKTESNMPFATNVYQLATNLKKQLKEKQGKELKRIAQRLQDIEFVGEVDLPLAQTVVKELCREIVGLTQQPETEEANRLESRAIAARRLIEQKMDFFRRLQQFHDEVKKLRAQNAAWRCIQKTEIPEVRIALQTQNDLICGQLNEERNFIESELSEIEANFFQAERDRVREKFRLICGQLENCAELIENREEYLKNVNDFIGLFNNDSALQEAGSSDETADLSSLGRVVGRLNELEKLAQLRVVDLTNELNAAQKLFPSAEETTSDFTVEAAQESSTLEEQNLLEELERRAPESPLLSERVAALRKTHAKRRGERDRLVNEAIEQAVQSLRKEISRLAVTVDAESENQNFAAINHLAETDGRTLHARLVELTDALGMTGLEKQRDAWQAEVGQLSSTLQDARTKLENTINAQPAMQHDVRREKRYLNRLEAFGQWLDVIEKELDDATNTDEFDGTSRVAKLEEIRDSCDARASLAQKLSKFAFKNADQLEQSRVYVDRYRSLHLRIQQLGLPVPRRIAVQMEGRPGTALSVTSFSSRSSYPDTGGSVVSEEIESDLQSVESETTRREAERLGLRFADDEPDLTADLLTASTSKPTADLPLSDIRAAVQQTLVPIHELLDHYSGPPLEKLENAKSDATKLKNRVKRLSRQRANILALAEKSPSERERKALRRLASDLRRDKHMAKKLHHELVGEIDAENQLRRNYTQIIGDLEGLETEVRAAASADQTPTEALEHLGRVELEIDLLKRQCAAPRRYVLTSIDGTESPESSSPNQRKRGIILRITNNVTTIIRVVEEAIQRQKAAEEAARRKSKKVAQKSKPIEQSNQAAFAQLHQKLNALQTAAASTVEGADIGIGGEVEIVSTIQDDDRDAHIESLLEAAVEVNKTINGLADDNELPTDRYDSLIRSSMEIRIGLESALKQIDAETEKRPSALLYRERVIDVMQTLLMSEESARQKQAAKTETAHEFDLWTERVAAQLRANEQIAHDATATLDQLQKRVDEAAGVLVDVLPWIDSSPLTQQQLNRVRGQTDRLRHSTEQLAAEQQHATKAQDLMAQSYRLLDLLNHTVENSLSLFPLSLQPAIDEFDTLKVSLEELDQMEQPIKNTIKQLQQIRGYVVPDLSVLRGMLSAIEAKRIELLRTLAEAERQNRAHLLCTQRLDRIDTTLERISAITTNLFNRYPTDQQDVAQSPSESFGIVDFRVAEKDVQEVPFARSLLEKTEEYLNEAEEFLAKATDDLKPEVRDEAQRKIDETRELIATNQKHLKSIEGPLATEVEQQTALIEQHNQLVGKVNELNGRVKSVIETPESRIEERVSELEVLVVELEAVVKESDALEKDAELKSTAIVRNPDDMNAPALASNVRAFCENVKHALEEAKQREKALNDRSKATEMILEIQTTIKKLQKQQEHTPSTLHLIHQKLSEAQDGFQRVYDTYFDSDILGEEVSNQLQKLDSQLKKKSSNIDRQLDQLYENQTSQLHRLAEELELLLEQNDLSGKELGQKIAVLDATVQSAENLLSDTHSDQMKSPRVLRLKEVIERSQAIRPQVNNKMQIVGILTQQQTTTEVTLKKLHELLQIIRDRGLRNATQAEDDAKLLTEARPMLNKLDSDLKQLATNIKQLNPAAVDQQAYESLVKQTQEAQGEFDQLFGDLMVELESELQLQELEFDLNSRLANVSAGKAQLNDLKQEVEMLKTHNSEVGKERKLVKRGEQKPGTVNPQIVSMLRRLDELDASAVAQNNFNDKRAALLVSLVEYQELLDKIKERGPQPISQTEVQHRQLIRTFEIPEVTPFARAKEEVENLRHLAEELKDSNAETTIEPIVQKIQLLEDTYNDTVGQIAVEMEEELQLKASETELAEKLKSQAFAQDLASRHHFVVNQLPEFRKRMNELANQSSSSAPERKFVRREEITGNQSTSVYDQIRNTIERMESQIDDIEREEKEEAKLSQRYDLLVAKINELPTGVVEKTEIQRLQTEVIPQVRAEAISLMDDTAKSAARNYVPVSVAPIDKLLDVIGDLSTQLNDKLMKAEQREPSEPVQSSEWNTRRSDVDAAVTSAINSAEKVLTPYAQGQPSQPLESAEHTLAVIPDQVENLKRASELVALTIEWIQGPSDLKPNKREANLKQMKKLIRKLDDKVTDLEELQSTLSEDVGKQRQIMVAVNELNQIGVAAREMPASPEEKLQKLEKLENRLHELDATTTFVHSDEHEVVPLIVPSVDQRELQNKVTEISEVLAKENEHVQQQLQSRTSPQQTETSTKQPLNSDVEIPLIAESIAPKMTAKIIATVSPDATSEDLVEVVSIYKTSPPTTSEKDEALPIVIKEEVIDAGAIISEIAPEYDSRTPKEKVTDAIGNVKAVLKEKNAASDEELRRAIQLLTSISPELQAVRLEVQKTSKDKKHKKLAKEREQEYVKLEADVQKTRAAVEKLVRERAHPSTKTKSTKMQKEIVNVEEPKSPPPSPVIAEEVVSEKSVIEGKQTDSIVHDLSTTPEITAVQFEKLEEKTSVQFKELTVQTDRLQPTIDAIKLTLEECARLQEPSMADLIDSIAQLNNVEAKLTELKKEIKLMVKDKNLKDAAKQREQEHKRLNNDAEKTKKRLQKKLQDDVQYSLSEMERLSKSTKPLVDSEDVEEINRAIEQLDKLNGKVEEMANQLVISNVNRKLADKLIDAKEKSEKRKADLTFHVNKLNEITSLRQTKQTEAAEQHERASEEWLQKKAELDSQLLAITSEVDNKLERYNTEMQTNAGRQNEEQTFKLINQNLNQARELLHRQIDWLQQTPNIDEEKRHLALEQINNELQRVDEKQNHAEELSHQSNELQRLKKLSDAQQKLQTVYYTLMKEVTDAQNNSSLEMASGQLNHVQAQIDVLLEEICLLQQQSEHQPELLLQSKANANLAILRDNVENLQKSLDSEQKDAQRQIQLNRIEHEMEQKKSELVDEIRAAESLLSSPEASIEQLKRSNDLLESARPKLAEINRLYDGLNDSDETTQSLRQRTADQLSSLGELFKNHQQSAQDRIDSLVRQQQDQLAASIEEAQKAISSPNVAPEDYEQRSIQLVEALQSAQPIQQSLPELNDLNRLLELAQSTRQAVDERADLWRLFREKRDQIGDKHETARQLYENVAKAGKRSPAQVRSDIESLQTASVNHLAPVQEDLERLSSLAQQLEPLAVAESELRFVEMDHKDLKDDYDELVKRQERELQDEQDLNAAIETVIEELNKLKREIGELSSEDLHKLNGELLPALSTRIDDIGQRDQQATADRQHVQRSWSSNSPDSARGLVNEIEKLSGEKLAELEKKKQQEAVEAEWMEKKNELDAQLLAITSSTTHVFDRYGENVEPKTIRDAEDDVQNVSGLRDKLFRARELLQSAIDWLNGNDQLPAKVKSEALKQLNFEVKKLDDEQNRLNSLEDQLNEDLRRQKELADEHQRLVNKLNELRDQAETAHGIENADEKKAKVEEVQARVAPLLQQLDELQKKSELKTIPLVQSHSSVNVAGLKDYVQNLQKSLDSEQKDAQRQIQLNRIEHEMEQKKSELVDEIRAAESLLSSPEASIEQLKRSNDLLESARPKLAEINRLYDGLNDSDETTQSLRQRTADQLSSLGELFKNHQQSAQDRIDSLVRQQQDQLAASIEEAQKAISSPNVAPEDYEQRSIQLVEALQSAQPIQQSLPELNDLNRLLELAQSTRQAVDERADLWRLFREKRDQIGDKHETARQLYENVAKAGKRSPAQVRSDIESLQTASVNHLAPVQEDLERLSSLAQQLEPLAVAESELRFVEMDHKDLKDDYDELVKRQERELQDEQDLNAAIETVIEELNKLKREIGELSSEDLHKLNGELLPALSTRIDDIGQRDQQATADRQHVQRSWSSNSPDSARGLVNEIEKLSGEKLAELEKRRNNKKPWKPNGWKRRTNWTQLLAITSSTTHVFDRYGENVEPKTIRDAEDDVQNVSGLRDKLFRARELLQSAIDWLNGNDQLPAKVKSEALKQLNFEVKKLDDEQNRLNSLEDQLNEDLRRQKELADEHQRLVNKLNELRDQAETAHGIENADEKKAKVEEVQARVAPLLQQLDELQKKSELKTIPLVQSHSSVNVAGLKDYVQNLQKSLDSEQKDAQRQIQLNRIEHEMEQKKSELVDEIRAAESLLSSPEASIEQLKRSNDLLESARPKLAEINRLYDGLNDSDETTQSLRQRTADQLSSLGELFKNHQQSAQDRIDSLVRQQQDQLAASIEEAQKAISSPNVAPEDYEQRSIQLVEALQSAQPIQQSLPELNDLNRLLELAQSTRQAVDERADLWRLFREKRDQIGDKHETARQLYENVAKAGKRSPAQVRSDIESLQTASVNHLAPVQEDLERLSSLAQQLEPLAVAESELRFVEMDHKDLKDDYDELVKRQERELQDEQDLNAAIETVIEELNKLKREIGGELSSEDLHKLNGELLPALSTRIDDIGQRDQQATADRQHVQRSWSSNSPDSARGLKKQQEAVEAEWMEKKNELDAQLLAITSSTTHVFDRYGENVEPKTIRDAEDDVQNVSGLRDKLFRARELLQSAIDWLNGNDQLPAKVKSEALKQLNFEVKKLDDEQNRLNSLEDQLNEDLRRQKELADEHQRLVNKLNELRDQAETAHGIENADEKKAKVEEVQARVAPLLQQLDELQKKSELKTIPLVQSSHSSVNVAGLKDYVQNLQKSLDSEQKDAQRQIQLNRIEHEMEQKKSELVDEIRAAESLLSSPEASIEQLKRSNDLLESARPKLAEINRLYDGLNDSDETTQSLRQRTADQLSSLGELFKNHQQSAQDRIDSLVRQQQDQLAASIEEAQKAISSPNVAPEDYEQRSIQLVEALQSAQPIQQSLPELNDLNRLLELAQSTRQAVDERADLWRLFREKRDQIGDKHETARQLYENVAKAGKRSPAQVRSDIESLQTASVNHLAPVQEDLERLSSLAQQLEPLAVAESELRFVEMDHKDLKDDYDELVKRQERELQDEQDLNAAIETVIEELNKLKREIGELSSEDLHKLNGELLPALSTRIDDIGQRDQQATADRQHVQRSWSSNSPDSARGLVNEIEKLSGEKLAELEKKKQQEAVEAEWMEKKNELDAQLLAITSSTTHVFDRYGENVEPKTIRDAEDDVQNVSGLRDKLFRARELLQSAIDWLNGNDQLPAKVKSEALKQLNFEVKKLDDEQNRLNSLEDQLNEDLRRQKELADEHQRLVNKLNELRDQAETAHGIEKCRREEGQGRRGASSCGSTIPLVQSHSSVNVAGLKDYVQNLQKSLDSEQKDAQRQIQLNRIEHEMEQKKSELVDEIRAAESLLSSPEASIEQLKRSNDLLESARPKLAEINRLYDGLNDSDETTQSLRQRTADQLSSLGELFKNHQQSAQDRIDSLVRQQQDQLAASIEEAQKAISSPNVAPEDYEQRSIQLVEALQSAQPIQQSLPELNDLNRLLELAQSTRQAVDERADLWRLFREKRDQIGDKHETARQLYENVAKAGKRSPAQVRSDIESLQTASVNHLAPVQEDLERLSSLAQQLEPLAVAESELRFVEMDHKDLKDDYDELVKRQERELQDEQDLNAAIETVIEELNKLKREIGELSSEDLHKLNGELLPALSTRIDDIGQRDQQATADRQHVQRSWSSNSPDSARGLVNEIEKLSGEKLAELEKKKQQEAVEAEWMEKKNELDAQLLAITSSTTHVFDRYGENVEPKTIRDAEDDVQNVSGLRDKLFRARELLQSAIDWLNGNDQLPAKVKSEALKQLNFEVKKLDDEQNRLNSLEDQLNEDLRRQKELADEHQRLVNKLNELRDQAETAHGIENADEKKAKVEEVQARVAPLLQQLDELQKKSELKTIPLVQSHSSVNVAGLKDYVQNLQKSLDSEQKDAQRQIQLNRIEHEMEQKKSELVDEIRAAESLLSSPEASIEQLKRSNDLLESARPKLAEINRLYDGLNDSDETTQSLRQRTADQLSSLGELFKNHQQSAQDRIDSLVRQQQDQLAASIEEAQKAISSPNVAPEDYEQRSIQLVEALQSAQPIQQSLPELNDLNRLLELAQSTRQAVDEHRQLTTKRQKIDVMLDAIEKKIVNAELLLSSTILSLPVLHNAANEFDETRRQLSDGAKLYDEILNNDADAIKLKKHIADRLKTLNERLNEGRRSVDDAVERILLDPLTLLNNMVSASKNLLNDRATNPDDYEKSWALLFDAIHQSDELTADPVLSTSTEEGLLPKLREVTQNAVKVRDQLNDKRTVWSQFCKLREAIFARLEVLKRPLQNAQEVGLQPLELAKQTIASLTEAHNTLDPLRDEIDALNDVALQLEPQDLPHSEVRFVEEDFDDLSEELENILLVYDFEASEEQRLQAATKEVLDELQQISERLEGLDYSELIDLDDHFIPALLAQLDNVRSRHELAQIKRRYVRRLDSAAIDETRGMVEEMHTRIRQRVQEAPKLEEGQERAVATAAAAFQPPRSPNEPPLNLDAASDLLAIAFPEERPRDVLRRYGFEHLAGDSDEMSSGTRTEPDSGPSEETDRLFVHAGPSSQSDYADEAIDDEDLALVSPTPAVNTDIVASTNTAVVPAANGVLVGQRRQRNRWRRVLFAALPYQVMLALLLAAACMIPDLSKEQSCENLHKLFEIHQQFINGPPPF